MSVASRRTPTPPQPPRVRLLVATARRTKIFRLSVRRAFPSGLAEDAMVRSRDAAEVSLCCSLAKRCCQRLQPAL